MVRFQNNSRKLPSIELFTDQQRLLSRTAPTSLSSYLNKPTEPQKQYQSETPTSALVFSCLLGTLFLYYSLHDDQLQEEDRRRTGSAGRYSSRVIMEARHGSSSIIFATM